MTLAKQVSRLVPDFQLTDTLQVLQVVFVNGLARLDVNFEHPEMYSFATRFGLMTIVLGIWPVSGLDALKRTSGHNYGSKAFW